VNKKLCVFLKQQDRLICDDQVYKFDEPSGLPLVSQTIQENDFISAAIGSSNTLVYFMPEYLKVAIYEWQSS